MFILAAAEPLLQPHWKTGDSFVIEMVRIREDSRRLQSGGASTTSVTVKILEANSKGSVADWIPGETKLSNPDMAKNPLVAKSMNAVKGLLLELVLDEDGAFTALRNQAEVVRQLERVVNVLLAELPSTPEVQAAMRQMLSPDLLVATAVKDAQMYFSTAGLELRQGLLVERPIEVPSPVGGGNLNAAMRISVTKLDSTRVTSRSAVRYDPESLAALSASLLKQAGARMTDKTWRA